MWADVHAYVHVRMHAHARTHARADCSSVANAPHMASLVAAKLAADPPRPDADPKLDGVKQCPQCGHGDGVSKTGGCNKMTCVCGARWCWVCGMIKAPSSGRVRKGDAKRELCRDRAHDRAKASV